VEFETVIGLEVHAQLLTKTKMFCGCTTPFGDAANTHGCPVCLGLPGSLPVLNREAVGMAVRMGLAVGCSIAPKSIFARKNYFYPDLPKGYQISQYDMPLCGPGVLSIVVNGEEKRIGITRVHLEEDAGKLIHDQDTDSLFDVNRCGTPLMEIVSEPDLRSPAEAYAYLMALKQLLEYLGICDCNMEEGSLRCDANISLRPVGQAKLGTKVELKNMNSFRSLEKALDYEVLRQADVLRSGGTIRQETYQWDPATNTSAPLRSKEDAHDYRYFPDPDLVPLVIEGSTVAGLRAMLPELPAARRSRFVSQYGLNAYAAEVLTAARETADYFEETCMHFGDAANAANWIMGEILHIVNDKKIAVTGLRVTPKRLALLLREVASGAISGQAGKKVIDLIEAEDKDPAAIIVERGLVQVSDASLLEEAVTKAIEANPKEAERFRAGEKKLMGFFVGQAIRLTGGRGNPKEISNIIMKRMRDEG
jgi:aspartyl-tRNA(Asn)/glutamyl-tRNA(Gln) amidotransferase subunit B